MNEPAEKKTQFSVGFKTSGLFAILNDSHLFIHRRPIWNVIFTFCLLLIYVSTTIFPTLMTYFKGNKSTLVYIIYIIFTGSPTYPNVDEVTIIVWFYFIIGAFIFVLYIIIFIVLLKVALPSSSIKRIYNILSFYILPVIVPVFGKAFTASMAYLSVAENSYSFFAAVIGELTIILYVILVSLMNSCTAYRVTHLYFQRDTFSSIIVNFAILIIQHTVSFLEHPNNILLVILTIFFLGADIFIFVVLPFQTKVVSIFACFYIHFCTGCAIVRAFTEYATPIGVGIIFGIAVFITTVMFLFRLLYEYSKGELGRILGLHRPRQLANITEAQLAGLSYPQLMVVARAFYSLNDETKERVTLEVNNRSAHTSEGLFFVNSFESRIKNLNIEAFPQVLNIIDRYTHKIALKEKSFWASLWLSDFESLPGISGQIGRLKYRLYEYCLYQSKVIPTFTADESIKPTSQRSVTHPIFNTIVVIIFIFAMYFLGVLVYCYHLSSENRSEFITFQNFMSNFTLIQSELWTASGRPQLSTYYNNAVNFYNKFLTYKEGPIHNLLNFKFNDTNMKESLALFFNLSKEANTTGTYDPRLKNLTIFHKFEYIMSYYFNIFDTKFPNRVSPHFMIWFTVNLICFIIFIIYFLFALIIYSKHLHKMFEVFKTFSKKKIEEYAELDTKAIQRSVIPGGDKWIEWDASRDIVFGFFLTFASFLIFVSSAFIVFSNTSHDYDYRTNSYIYFQRMDLIMMWFSAVHFQNSTLVNSTVAPAIGYCDFHMDILMRDEGAKDFANIINDDIVSLITDYILYNDIPPEIDPLDLISKTFLAMLQLEEPLYNISNIYYITWMVVFLLIILSFSIILHLQIMVGRQMDASRGERINLIENFTEFAGEQEPLDSIVPVENRALPFLFIEANSEYEITFITQCASSELHISNGDVFDGQPFGSITGSEIKRTIDKLKQYPSSEPQQIKASDGSYIYVIPSYCGSTMTTLKSFAIFRLPAVLSPFINTGGDKNMSPFSSLFPSVISPDKAFPHIIQINAAPFLVVLVRLTNLTEWATKVEPQFVESFYKSVIECADKICEDGQLFMRVNVRDDMILFMTNPDIQIQGRWTFITNCADFSLKLREAIRMTAKKFKCPVFGSLVFARGEKQVMYLGNHACTQCDFLPDTLDLQFVEQALDIFRIDATAFAVAHRPNLRIPNTTLVANYLSSGGTSIDLFLVA